MDKMENVKVLDLLFSRRAFNLLNFMPGILLKTYNADLVSAIVNLKKMEKMNFHVECISNEYFEDLLARNEFKLKFVGDPKSCALLSLNSLLTLSIKSQSWIKIKLCSGNIYGLNSQADKNTVLNQEYVDDIFEPSDSKRNWYMIQCFAVSSVDPQVLYVTNEKYFNLMNHFGIRSIASPRCKIIVNKVTEVRHMKVAKEVVLACIHSGNDIELTELEKIVYKFFETPKYLKFGEIFEINIAKILPFLQSKITCDIEKIYLQVTDLIDKSDKESNEIGYYIKSENTNISIITKIKHRVPPVYKKYISLKYKLGYEIDICPGGLDRYYEKLKNFLEIIVNDHDVNLKPMVLLTGPKGAGKKTVLNCVALRMGFKLFTLDCFDFFGVDLSKLDSKLITLTAKIKKLVPCILLMDNIELLGRDEKYDECVSTADAFQRHINGLLGQKLDYPVVIVASCSLRVPDIVPSIKRMFIQTIEFEQMKKDDVFRALSWLMDEAGMICDREVLDEVAGRLNGYLFADLDKLVRLAVKFQKENLTFEESERNILKIDHLNKAINITEGLYADSIGSAKVPSVHWDDVGGLENLKEEITLAFNFPARHPELMASGLRLSGFLFYGPPGTGKTLMAKAVATEFSYNFLSVKGPELMNMYVGQSEKNVREVFQRARDAAPCIIFFDEIDSLAPKRGRSSGLVTDRIVSQLLTEMDGLQSNTGVFIIGATNRPDLVDPALLRPGRFDKMFYVGVCNTKETKLSVIKALTKRFSLADDVDLEMVVESLPSDVTGADIYSVCSNSWLGAARRYINELNSGGRTKLPIDVTMADFHEALAHFVPSLTPDIIEYYDKFRNDKF